jgi:hypothetical protein
MLSLVISIALGLNLVWINFLREILGIWPVFGMLLSLSFVWILLRIQDCPADPVGFAQVQPDHPKGQD